MNAILENETQNLLHQLVAEIDARARMDEEPDGLEAIARDYGITEIVGKVHLDLEGGPELKVVVTGLLAQAGEEDRTPIRLVVGKSSGLGWMQASARGLHSHLRFNYPDPDAEKAQKEAQAEALRFQIAEQNGIIAGASQIMPFCQTMAQRQKLCRDMGHAIAEIQDLTERLYELESAIAADSNPCK